MAQAFIAALASLCVIAALIDAWRRSTESDED